MYRKPPYYIGMLRKGTHHHNAQGVIGLLIVIIGFVLFYKLAVNQDFFNEDMGALRNYAALSIVTMGFLLGLFYLATKPHISSKTTKKKKRK